MMRVIFPDDIKPFTFQATPVRVTGFDGGIWFCAMDICLALGLEKPEDQTARLDPDQKQNVALPEERGLPAFEIISTSGVYSLIFAGHPASAKLFTKWMAQVVAPYLQRCGSAPHLQMEQAEQSAALVPHA